MMEHDIEKNGVITFQEFKYIFLDVADKDDYYVKRAENGGPTHKWINLPNADYK